ncbi:MAG: transporter substrate-binding domain-containing protein [Desulfobacter sp.]|nr:MAG: transporter substrate-binding domain-containing protein [Desulfobacter sp.]
MSLYSPVSARETVRFVYFDQFEPFSWCENGQMKGLFVDVVNMVFKELDMDVDHQGFPWKRAQLMVEHGMADGMCTISTAKRLNYTLPTAYPVVQMDFKIFTGAGNPRLDALKRVETPKDLEGFRLIDILGSGWAETNLKGMDLSFELTYPAIFRLLRDGIYDAAVRNNVQTRYLIKKHGYADVLLELPRPMNRTPVSYRMLISKISLYSTLIDRINGVLKKLKDDGTLVRIYDRYR